MNYLMMCVNLWLGTYIYFINSKTFQIGYNRAARIVDQLEQLDYISGANGSKPRDVFITEADLKKE